MLYVIFAACGNWASPGMRFRTEAVLQPSFPERLSGFVAALPGQKGGRACERLATSVASIVGEGQTTALGETVA